MANINLTPEEIKQLAKEMAETAKKSGMKVRPKRKKEEKE